MTSNLTPEPFETSDDGLPFPLPMVEAASAALSAVAERHGMTFLSEYPTHFSLAVLRAALEPIRELHKPVPQRRSNGTIYWLRCEGCDLGPHPEDCPDWPCSTADLVYTADEIAAAEKTARD